MNNLKYKGYAVSTGTEEIGIEIHIDTFSSTERGARHKYTKDTGSSWNSFKTRFNATVHLIELDVKIIDL